MAAEASDKKPHFSLPDFLENPNGWGPCGGVSKYADLPYEPFNKAEMLGRISDWNQQSYPQRGFSGGPMASAVPLPRVGGLEDDESAFSVVDNKPKLKPKGQRKPYRQRWVGAQQPQQRNQRGGRGGRGGGRGGSMGGGAGNRLPYNQRGRNDNRGPRKRWQTNPWQQQHIKDISLALKPEWKQIDESDFSSFSKLSAEPTNIQDLVQAGTLEVFHSKFDAVSTANPVNLTRFENRQFFTTTASDDPVIQKLAEKKEGNVFITDTVMSVLMAAPRSVQQWDIIVRKEGNVLFFDKRPTSRIDFLTVNENWSENLAIEQTSPNHPYNLSVEATLINHNFSQQVLLKEGAVNLPEPNPFADAVDQGNQAASIGYRYRKWNLGDDIELVARCELNALSKPKSGDDMKVTVKALNEFDPRLSGGVDWRKSLSAQTGAVLATEMKNNSNKLTRWTAQSIIAGADQMILGFVSRVSPKDNSKHVIVKIQRFKPRQFATQIKFNERNAWGIVKHYVQKLRKLDDGTYLLFKDNAKPSVQLLSIPADAFDLEEPAEHEESAAPVSSKAVRSRPGFEEEYEEEHLDA